MNLVNSRIYQLLFICNFRVALFLEQIQQGGAYIPHAKQQTK